MNDLIVKEFNNEKFYNFIWDDRPCWIAVEVAELFGYAKKAKAIFDCIRREQFEEGIEYDVLNGEKLKYFKEVFMEQLGSTKYAPKVVIFYEEGLYGFLSYTEMPLGVEFRNWIRREVIPSLRAKGYYVMNNFDKEDGGIEKPIIRNVNFNKGKTNNEKIENYKMALESAKMFEPLLHKVTKDSTYKFLYLKKLFVDAGIELPKFIEEEWK